MEPSQKKQKSSKNNDKLFDVVVVGSLMTDLVAYCETMPKVGETVRGSEFSTGFGGKGANQAVQCRYLGSKVAFVGRLGRDAYGNSYDAHFRTLGIDCRHLQQTEGVASGVAPIWVDKAGHNSIIIVPGSNSLLTPDDVDQAKTTLTAASIVLTQLEVPVETTVHALRVGREAGAVTVCNPAPAMANLPDELFQLSDIFCPNETEAELITGVHIESGGSALLSSAKKAAAAILAKGAKHVIITLGASGAYLLSADRKVSGKTSTGTHVPASAKVRPSSVVDSTGAGDSYLGALTHFLAASTTSKSDLSSSIIISAMRKAAIVAGKSVQGKGTQTSFPKIDNVRELL